MIDDESNIGKMRQDDNSEVTPVTVQSGAVELKPSTWLQLKEGLRKRGPWIAGTSTTWIATMIVYGYATGIFNEKSIQEEQPSLLALKMIGGLVTAFIVTSASNYLYDRYISPRLRRSSKSLNLNI